MSNKTQNQQTNTQLFYRPDAHEAQIKMC